NCQRLTVVLPREGPMEGGVPAWRNGRRMWLPSDGQLNAISRSRVRICMRQAMQATPIQQVLISCHAGGCGGGAAGGVLLLRSGIGGAGGGGGRVPEPAEPAAAGGHGGVGRSVL